MPVVRRAVWRAESRHKRQNTPMPGGWATRPPCQPRLSAPACTAAHTGSAPHQPGTPRSAFLPRSAAPPPATPCRGATRPGAPAATARCTAAPPCKQWGAGATATNARHVARGHNMGAGSAPILKATHPAAAISAMAQQPGHVLLLLLPCPYSLCRDDVCLPRRVGCQDAGFKLGVPPAQLPPLGQAVLWVVQAPSCKQLLLCIPCSRGSAQVGVSTQCWHAVNSGMPPACQQAVCGVLLARAAGQQGEHLQANTDPNAGHALWCKQLQGVGSPNKPEGCSIPWMRR